MIRMFKKFRLFDLVLFIILVGLTIGKVFIDLELPDYTGTIVSQMMMGSKTNEILNTGFKMLGISFACIFLQIIIGFLATFIATNFSRRMRMEVFKKIESFSIEEMSMFETSSLITRTTNDIQQVQMGFGMSMRMALSAPITALLAIIKIYNVDISLSLAVGGAIVAMILMIIIVFIIVMPKFRKVQKLTDRLNGVARENLTGIRVVRAYDADEFEQNKFQKANDELTSNNLFANRVMGIMGPSMNIVMASISLIVYWLGAYKVAEGLEYSNLTKFTTYSMQILMSFITVSMLLIMLPRANVSANRIHEVLDTFNKINDPLVPLTIKGDTSLEFKDVTFTYPQGHDAVLHNLSFKVNKGETLAIIGATGSGKTTLVNLIPRFIDASSGEVLVNGVNVKDILKHDLREHIGYVPQKRFLFSGTVKENIKFGEKEISDEKMIEAGIIACADEFIKNMPDGYDSHIAQGGKNVSGGQMQRLSIARAVAHDPKIYIFDDSFSALDYKTDKLVRERLKESTKDSIKIIVAQRIGTIMDADKIIVLDDGHMVGYGRHKDLLQSCKVYQEIAISQLSKEELGL